MFTGIVETVGRVVTIERTSAGARLTVDTEGLLTPSDGRDGAGGRGLALGDSVCVQGVCLSVTAHRGSRLSFDVVSETLERTTLGAYSAGMGVNLELSLRAGDPIGGHFVQGHVDAVGEVVGVQKTPSDRRVTIRPVAGPGSVLADVIGVIVPKGAITVDGVSLTVAAVDGGTLEVALIPTTLERTTLSRLATGGRVNLETDVISRTVVHWLDRLNSAGDAPGQTSGHQVQTQTAPGLVDALRRLDEV